MATTTTPSLDRLNDDTLLCILEHAFEDPSTITSAQYVCKRLFALCNHRYIWISIYRNHRLRQAYGDPSVHDTQSIRRHSLNAQRLDCKLSQDHVGYFSQQAHPFASNQDQSGRPQFLIVSNFLFLLECFSILCHDMESAMDLAWEHAIPNDRLGGEVSIKATRHKSQGGPVPLIRLLVCGENDTIVTTFNLKWSRGGRSALRIRKSHRLGRAVLGAETLENEWLLPSSGSPSVINTHTGRAYDVQHQDYFVPRMSSLINSDQFLTVFGGFGGCMIAIFEFPKDQSQIDETIMPLHCF